MIYRGLNWLQITGDMVTAAQSLRATRRQSPQGVLYTVDAIDPQTKKTHRIRSAVRLLEWQESVGLAVKNDLVSFDGIPFEIHAIEDEAAYEAAKAAYLAAMLVSE